MLRSLGAGMLLMWDCGLHSFEMALATRQRGAHFLGRAKASIILKPVRRLADGSYLADVYPSQYARRCERDGLRVRAIEYRVGRQGEPIRLVTSLLDHGLDPALQHPPGNLACVQRDRRRPGTERRPRRLHARRPRRRAARDAHLPARRP